MDDEQKWCTLSITEFGECSTANHKTCKSTYSHWIWNATDHNNNNNNNNNTKRSGFNKNVDLVPTDTIKKEKRDVRGEQNETFIFVCYIFRKSWHEREREQYTQSKFAGVLCAVCICVCVILAVCSWIYLLLSCHTRDKFLCLYTYNNKCTQFRGRRKRRVLVWDRTLVLSTLTGVQCAHFVVCTLCLFF